MAVRVKPQAVMKALSDETRLRCLALLYSSRDELCVGDLIEALNLPQPKVSRHLSALRSAQLVVDRRQATWVYYRLNPDLPSWARGIFRHAIEGFREDARAERDLRRLQRAVSHRLAAMAADITRQRTGVRDAGAMGESPIANENRRIAE